MKTKLLCLLLAFLMLLSLAACNGEPDAPGGNVGSVDPSTTEHYLPEKLFADIQKEFEKKVISDFPTLSYSNAPFMICDDALAGKKIVQISLPVRKTGKVDADGKLRFTLHIVKNNFEALKSAKKAGVVTHEVKVDPVAYELEVNKIVSKYITVDLSAYNIQLAADQTLAIGAKDDTLQIASMNTRAVTSGTAKVIKTWREEWLVPSYLANLFTGKKGESEGGIYCSRNSLPVDFVFDYGTAEAKQAVVDARKAEEEAYNAKLKAVAEAYGGKYLSLIGDSISSFRGITDNVEHSSALINNRCYYSTTSMNDHTQMYWGRLAEECNMELCVINGWSSSKVYGGGRDKNDKVDATKDNMLVRSTTLHNNQGQKPDVILLYMGINDVSSKHWSDLYDRLMARGNRTQREIVEEWLISVHYVYDNNKDQITPGSTYTSWEASYALSLERMQYNYPDAEIYMINLIRSHHGSGSEEKITKANTCLAALADYYGATIVDQANNEVNYENCHLYGADEADPNGLHPNISGHAALTKLIVETIYEKLPK